jgi:antitoxin component HigA of HigAB toxin-antitoxin module
MVNVKEPYDVYKTLLHDPETGLFRTPHLAPIRLTTGKLVNTSALSRTELANQVGCSVANVSRVLSGGRMPRLSMARKFAQALGLTLDEFTELLDHVGR